MRQIISIVKRLYEEAPFPGDVEGTMKVGPVTYDQVSGLGAVPFNQNVKYMGFATFMRPSVFLRLATERTYPDDFVIHEMDAGHPIGSPFLDVSFDEEIPRVKGHEGRGRAAAVRKLYGDIPMLVHCFLDGLRARHLKLDMLSKFRHEAVPERQTLPIAGPHFSEQVWWLDGWKNLE